MALNGSFLQFSSSSVGINVLMVNNIALTLLKLVLSHILRNVYTHALIVQVMTEQNA